MVYVYQHLKVKEGRLTQFQVAVIFDGLWDTIRVSLFSVVILLIFSAD